MGYSIGCNTIDSKSKSSNLLVMRKGSYQVLLHNKKIYSFVLKLAVFTSGQFHIDFLLHNRQKVSIEFVFLS